MNNVFSLGLRLAQSSSRSHRWRSASTLFLCQSSNSATSSVRHRAFITVQFPVRRPAPCSPTLAGIATNRSHLRAFHQCSASQILKAYDDKKERGLSFQSGYLRPEELSQIFQYDDLLPPQALNRLLRVLHARRVDGTLDLPLPTDMAELVEDYPDTFETGLSWLRETFPIDEDAAVVARLDREAAEEEKDNPSELMQRGEDLGLYRPQSGNYFAKLSEKEGDPYGESELEKIRAENDAATEREEQELEEQIQKRTEELKEKQSSTALAERPGSDIEATQQIRPPNEFERWVMRARQRATSKLTLDSDEVAGQTTFQRLAPSSLVMVAVCGLSYAFAHWWTPPKRSERIIPDVSLTFATLAGLLAANVLVFLLWKFPPALRMLNTYFVVTPGYPKALSIVGNIFSHYSAYHLFLNMLGLFIMGAPLHEEFGRGTVLAIYVGAGVVGSFASLTSYVLRGMLMTSSMGASGCVCGLMAARFWSHSDDSFSLWFLPESLQRYVDLKGWAILGAIGVFELISFLSPAKQIDHAAHIGGMVTGVICAEWLKRTSRSSNESATGSARWYDSIIGK